MFGKPESENKTSTLCWFVVAIAHSGIYKWEENPINFVAGFPKTVRKHESIIVIMDRFAKVPHFIPIWTTHKASNIAES